VEEQFIPTGRGGEEIRWLLNMNMPRSLKQLLESVEHQCRHTGEIGLERASDWVVLEEAAREGEVVLTHDLDYGHLLAFSGASKPSVVIIRLSRPTPRNIFERLMVVWAMIERPLMEGAIVALEDATVRIRRLPIRHDKQSGG
jgi:predicted nuclease of predicted toxin-antitoxin system